MLAASAAPGRLRAGGGAPERRRRPGRGVSGRRRARGEPGTAGGGDTVRRGRGYGGVPRPRGSRPAAAGALPASPRLTPPSVAVGGPPGGLKLLSVSPGGPEGPGAPQAAGQRCLRPPGPRRAAAGSPVLSWGYRCPGRAGGARPWRGRRCAGRKVRLELRCPAALPGPHRVPLPGLPCDRGKDAQKLCLSRPCCL